MEIPKREALHWLVDHGLVEMGDDGRWKPTREGRLLVASMKQLQELEEKSQDGS